METLEKSQQLDSTDNIKSVFSSENTEGWEVLNTPFTIVRIDNEWSVLMGKYQVSKEHKTRLEAYEDAMQTGWNRLLQVIAIMIEKYK